MTNQRLAAICSFPTYHNSVLMPVNLKSTQAAFAYFISWLSSCVKPLEMKLKNNPGSQSKGVLEG